MYSAEKRSGNTGKRFLEILDVDSNCFSADVCRGQPATLEGDETGACCSVCRDGRPEKRQAPGQCRRGGGGGRNNSPFVPLYMRFFQHPPC